MSYRSPNDRDKSHAARIRRPRPANPVEPASHRSAPPMPIGPEAGDRPVSARQQYARENRITSSDIIDRAVPRRTVPAPSSPSLRRVRTRDAETTVVRLRHARPRTNRRSVYVPGVILRGALVVLGLEVMATLLFSPRLRVTSTVVEGNSAVPTARILNLMQIPPTQNIVRLPTGQIRARLLTEPMIESVAIHRSLPSTVHVVVTERVPWATVALETGKTYTIDAGYVPFRTAADQDRALPKLKLATPPGAPAGAVTLGKPLQLPGLSDVQKCLAWAAAHQFAVGSFEIAPEGELCLNRADGAQIQLGSSEDLDRKLQGLATLFERKPELATSHDLAYINLYAADAPAVMTRTALAAVQQAAAKAVVARTADSAGGTGNITPANPAIDNTPAPAAAAKSAAKHVAPVSDDVGDTDTVQ